MILVAVIDINILATTGADLNHFVRNILKSDFIMFRPLQMNQLEMHQPIKLVREDSKEPIFLKQ
tara:strand:+ start:260 stop:451 length:192 start_codon:yes stop_codon:yes gene_type:complete